MCIHAEAQVQSPLGDPTGRPRQERFPVPEKEPAPPPSVEVPPPQVPTEVPAHPAVTAFIRQIKILGNTVFTDEQLNRVTAPYTNRRLSSEDIEALRIALTLFYVNQGYVNSGAIVPDQKVNEGVLTIQVIEGRLTKIEVEGNSLFQAGFFKDRIQPPPNAPLNIRRLQEQLQILQQDERIDTINANLRPGAKQGDAVLDVKVKEESPFRAYLEVNNYQPVNVGAEAIMLTLQHLSLTGHGDILSFGIGGSSGTWPRIETSYSLPINRHDGTLTFEYRKNDFSVVRAAFQDLDITSKSNAYSITYRQPIYRTVYSEVALGITGENINNKNFLDDIPFSFYPGVQDGKSVVTAIRTFQEWTYRTAHQFVALRSRLSLGIDALDATTNSHGLPDSRFFSWLFQGRWAFRHQPFNMQTLVRVDAQLTPDSLMPLEQMSIGGRYTVRGYVENQLVRDNGVSASIETRFPIVRNKPWASILDLCAFYDFGHSWNTDFPSPKPRTLDSVGLGLRWELSRPLNSHFHPQFELYWGIPLRNVDNEGGNVQEHGIHFRFLLMYW
jgi:hemolysin activation/secretion protein